ncbi:MAG: NUDIX hydrolase [Anaerolineaceae bacterium]|nr:NUDIX hydrolase [Anaerolineaceae bacterium]
MKFSIISREIKYQGRAFSVEDIKLQLPDGNESVFNLVRHTGSVSIVPVDSEGNLLFVRQYRLGSETELLELPAGTKSPDEDPLECACREIREETGMAAKTMKLLGDIYLAPGYSSERMYVFLATDLYFDPLEADADEFLAIEKISIKTAYEMAENGDIHDSKSLAALLLAASDIRK